MNTKSESALVIERVLDADPGRVFEAITTAETMRQWFHPGKEGWSASVEADAKIDGTYKLDMSAPDGKMYTHTGTYVELDPPRKVAFTWNTHAVRDTLVSIELRAAGAGTRLTLTHEFLPQDQVEGHRKGWTECLENLGDAVAS
jgi:uncharacterized protein YndB with AHSA1/START domain